MSLTAKEVCLNASILEVAGNYINISGTSLKNAKAVCPFHDDHNPSLSFYRSKKNGEERYHCFVCHASGNAADFVMNYEKEYHGRDLSYLEAVEKVAEICHLDYQHSGTFKNRRPKNKREADLEKLQGVLSYYLYAKQSASKICELAETAGHPNTRKFYFEMRKVLKDCGAGFVPSEKSLQKMHETYLQRKRDGMEAFDVLEAVRNYNLTPNSLVFPLKDKGRQIGFLKDELYVPENAGKDIFLCSSPEEALALDFLGFRNAASAERIDDRTAVRISSIAEHVTIVPPESRNFSPACAEINLKRALRLMKAGIKTDILAEPVSSVGINGYTQNEYADKAVRPYAYALLHGASYEKALRFASSPLEKFDCRRKSELIAEADSDRERG